jgi:acetylornithine deacetylase/succinyl-diaminopimelate desuccinylase-like protein
VDEVSHTNDDLAAWLDARADEMAGLVMALVAIDTENPPGRGLRECGAVLRDAMARLGLEPELIPLGEDACIVRGSVGSGSRLVYFHGHFDVVPAQSRAQFSPRREGGRIVGRGTADMKGGLVSMLYGAAAARELGLLDDTRIVLHCVCDEETGSTVGSGHLRSAGLIDAAAVAMLTPEPTGGVIWNGCRGAITLRVDVHGREAHVGYANTGVNAFEHMVRVAAPLTELAHELFARDSMLIVGGASGSGANFNVVPGAAWFSVDRRFNPDEDLDTEVDRLTSLIESAGADVSVELLQRAPSASTDPAHARRLARIITEIEGAPPVVELCPGVLETRWYAQLGIPAFAYGAGRLDVSHGPDEYIDEAAMRRCAAVYARFAQNGEH